MALISGRGAKLQIGRETTWGTAVAPTDEVPFTSESMRYVPNYQAVDALLGYKTTGEHFITNEHVEGSFDFIAKPDDFFGLILAAATGDETAAAQVAATTAYDHVFKLLANGSANSLPHLTVVVDRKTAVAGYISCKVDSLELSAAKNDFMRGTVNLVGYDEAVDALESLSAPATAPFQFSHGAITIDGTPYSDIENVSLSITNNVERDLQTLGSGVNMEEIEPQDRSVTLSMDVIDTTTTNTLRTNKFKAGATAAVILTFTSVAEIESGYYYTLTISMPLCYITQDDPSVSGPDRLRHTISLQATENDSNEPITITYRDDKSTNYLS